MREMTISMARVHRDWCKAVRFFFAFALLFFTIPRHSFPVPIFLAFPYSLSPFIRVGVEPIINPPLLQNLAAWEDAKKEIAKIEPHPNRPGPGEDFGENPAGAVGVGAGANAGVGVPGPSTTPGSSGPGRS